MVKKLKDKVAGNRRRNFRLIPDDERIQIIAKACKQVSRGVFFSTLIIITSFLPVFLITGQEGKLLHPLSFTNTFIMIVNAILLLTLAHVCISFFMIGNLPGAAKN